mmetsp:Transcript_110748/g.324018  ORF Transcript_110748/g.324018 Transcript_110748/m.324018 type:complete len:220 (-) Transcript_110748:1700-2359(-)
MPRAYNLADEQGNRRILHHSIRYSVRLQHSFVTLVGRRKANLPSHYVRPLRQFPEPGRRLDRLLAFPCRLESAHVHLRRRHLSHCGTRTGRWYPGSLAVLAANEDNDTWCDHIWLFRPVGGRHVEARARQRAGPPAHAELGRPGVGLSGRQRPRAADRDGGAPRLRARLGVGRLVGGRLLHFEVAALPLVPGHLRRDRQGEPVSRAAGGGDLRRRRGRG